MFDSIYASVQEIHRAYREKRISVTEVVLQHFSRIAAVDSCENGLNAVIEINPDALSIAKTLDIQMGTMDALPPLFGIPVLLKDNINTGDRLHTTAGSVALADNYAPCDAPIVARLRQAGAVILGKANMTEFANYMSRENMPSGYSSRGGQTLNPYNREKTPSGSSSGSAVAVAAGLCTVSVGTETSGSIISPASHCGIVGVKPTIGLLEQAGIIPISGTFDTAGPMARTVADTAVLLDVMAGNAAEKPLSIGRLDGLRIGLNRKLELDEGWYNPIEAAIFEKLCTLLETQGAVLVDDLQMASPRTAQNAIMRYEFKACINHYLSTWAGKTKMQSLQDIIEYNQAHAAVALKYGQSLLLDSENNVSGRFVEPAYLDALAARQQSIAEMEALFDANNLDLLLGQTFAYIAPFTGFPSMTLPMGQRKDNYMPQHAYFTARRFHEGAMIKAAYAVEQVLGLQLQPEV